MAVNGTNRRDRHHRRGTTVVLVLVCLTSVVMFASLSVDVGYMYNTRAELQRTADAAALAGAVALMNQDRLKSDSALQAIIAASRSQVGSYVGINEVFNETLTVNASDVVVGYLSNPHSATEELATENPGRFNAVRALVRRDDVANGPVDLFFASVMGHDSVEISASAAAAFMDGIRGYRATEPTGNAELLPLALKDTAWINLINESGTVQDNWSYNATTGAVTAGPDGIPELNLYPGSGGTQLPPGNFGTVDIGPPNNSTSDLSRQIREGVSPEDLSYFGGSLELGPDGTLELNGDTGLSAAIKDDLESIIGLPRAIPLFSSVSGNGNNSTYTIVGFAGIRILDVRLTGAMSQKRVIVQPAVVIDDSVLVGQSDQSSYFVYAPLRLVR